MRTNSRWWFVLAVVPVLMLMAGGLMVFALMVRLLAGAMA